MGFETQEQKERFAEHADHLRKAEAEERLLKSAQKAERDQMFDNAFAACRNGGLSDLQFCVRIMRSAATNPEVIAALDRCITYAENLKVTP